MQSAWLCPSPCAMIQVLKHAVFKFYKFYKVLILLAYLSGTHMTGGGSMHRDTMLNCIQLGLSMGEQLNKLLVKMLKSEENRVGPKRPKTVGFLK